MNLPVTIIKRCTCNNTTQDILYGSKKRVFNLPPMIYQKKWGIDGYVCTSCQAKIKIGE
jgi:hypothetical protein